MPFVSLSDFHWMQNWNFLVVSEEVNAVLPAWFFFGREKDTPCLCSDEHFEKPCPGVPSTGPGRAQPDAAALGWYFFFPFLSFRVTTTWSAVLHRSRWTCDESHGYGFPRPAQFPTRKPGLPTPHLPIATHHLRPTSRWWNPPREDSGSLTWLCEKKVQLQNDQDGGHLPFWTLASSPSPLSFPSLHLSSLKLLAKGWFLNFFSFFFFFLVEVDFFFVFKMREVVFVMLLMETYI